VSELQKEAERRLSPQYSKAYKTVITLCVVAVYSYGYYLAWADFGRAL